LRDLWTGGIAADVGDTGVKQDVTSYIHDLRDRLTEAAERAKEFAQATQDRQKVFYDKHSAHMQFEPGSKVLVLQPSSSQKIMAELIGPYTVIRRIGQTNNYEIDTGRRKVTLHVNLLRQWYDREANVAMVITTDSNESEDEDFPNTIDFMPRQSGMFNIGDTLSPEQKQ
jgi:hypothetical protein